MTCACGEAIASSMEARPAATMSSASESSLVTRCEPAVMSRVSFGPVATGASASQYARLSPSQHTVIFSRLTTTDT
jgi:hypothetical protein